MPEEKTGIYRYEPLWKEWHIEELIGKGSYGEVYRIYREKNGKREYAAAKYISIPKTDELKGDRRFSDQELTIRYAQRADKLSIEISSMLQLKDSKNVVHYEQHIKEPKGKSPGWDIIIRMELLTSLEDYLDANAFTKRDVIRLGLDLCSAIASCQEHDIVHRDIKIENMFLDAVGNYKLGDFGVSRVGKGTATGTVAGTLDYMAPEVLNEHKYNSTVDIYALGIAMYQLLNNRRNPFIDADYVPNSDEEEEANQKRLRGDAFPDPKFDSGELARIIKKACAFRRQDRYATPGEMAEDLKKLLAELKENPVVLQKKSRRKLQSGETETEFFGSGGMTEREFTAGKGTVRELDLPKKKSKKPLIIGLVGATCIGLTLSVTFFRIAHREIPLEAIEQLPLSTVQMVVGDHKSLHPVPYPDNATTRGEEAEYTSSDETVVTVDQSGEITAKKEGEAVITVTWMGISEEVEVHVTKKRVAVTGITGNISETMTLTVGENTQLSCKVAPQDATDQTIRYESSDSSVADIGEDGVITAKKAGQTTITAKASDGVSRKMTLTVKEKEQSGETPANDNSNTGSDQTWSDWSGNQNTYSYQQPANPAPQQNYYEPPVNEAPPADTGGGGDTGGSYNSGDRYREYGNEEIWN